MSVSQPPAIDEIEVSLFGPGYGETVVVHLGLGEWLLVDSCIDSRSKRPASLNYLRKIGVDLSSAVKIILASHWHDDHIRGLAALFEECKAASFWCSSALQWKEFATLVQAGAQSIDQDTREFAKVMSILRERKLPGPEWAGANTRIWQRTSGAVTGEIFSLSPSSAAITLSYTDIAQLLPRQGESAKKMIPSRPNRAAVVLWLTLGDHAIVLGSDLEEEKTLNPGWSVIVNSNNRPSGTAQVFKVPHHGSENGHHADVWSKMLTSDPFAILTPFVNGGVSLPKLTDVRRICEMTTNAYSTRLIGGGQKRRSGALVKAIRESTRSIRTIPNTPGHVRMRKKASSNDAWHVDVFDGAGQLKA